MKKKVAIRDAAEAMDRFAEVVGPYSEDIGALDREDKLKDLKAQFAVMVKEGEGSKGYG